MKKTIILLFTIVFIIVTILFVSYNSYQKEKSEIIKSNLEYEEYKDKKIYGLHLGTLINKTIDKNLKNKIEKDENQMFIPNDENSIQIEIYMKDNEQTYKMEAFYNSGMQQFMQYYKEIEFKCSKIEYHKKTGRVKYLLFEQQVTS